MFVLSQLGRVQRAWALTACLSLCACASLKSAQSKVIQDRWLLVYAGSTSRTRYEKSDFELLLGRGTGCARPLFTGVVFLSLQWRQSGRWFASWLSAKLRGPGATGEDWQAYRDSLIAPSGVFQRLNDALRAAYPGSRVDVAVMVPYLGPSTPELTIDGRRYVVSDSLGRRSLYEGWLRELSNETRKSAFSALRFVGGYWLNEGLLPGDSAVIRSAVEAARADSLRLLWIPSYHARGASDWRKFGFTDVWYQPNFFFDSSVPSSRLDSAADFASQHAMGLELEFDRRLLNSPNFAERLAPYLRAVKEHPPRSIAVYDGAGALLDLLSSRESAARATAKGLIEVLCPNDSVI